MNYIETYFRDENGNLVLVETQEVEAPTTEDLIKDKEQQMLELYEEIKRLKGE
jgi:hypothetical protein